MKRVVLSKPHWSGTKLHQPGEVVEMSDEDFEWFLSATQEARIAHQLLAEEQVGSEAWFRKEVSKKTKKAGSKPTGEADE